MPDIGGSQTLVDSMNSVTRMSDISFGLSHRMTGTRDSSDNGDTGAVKAQMRKTNSAEKVMPFFCGVLRQIDELLPLLFLGAPNERDDISMNRGGVNAIAFHAKTDRAAFQIYIADRHSRLRDTAALSHRHQPRILHPRVLFLERCFDFVLLGRGNFWLLPWRDSLVPEFQTWIGCDVIPPYGFLQNGRENFQLSERCVELSCPDHVARWIRAELRIRSANLIRYLKRRNYVDVLQIRGNRRPRVRISCQRLGIRILICKESWHPNVEAIALSVSIDVKFAHGVLCRYLFYLSKRAVVVDSNLGTLVCPGAIGALVSNPIEWADVSLVIRCHALQHSAAKQNPSMTISLGR
jgi:hypothetical protein